MVKRHVGGTGSRIFAFPSWRWLALWGSLLALQAQAEHDAQLAAQLLHRLDTALAPAPEADAPSYPAQLQVQAMAAAPQVAQAEIAFQTIPDSLPGAATLDTTASAADLDNDIRVELPPAGSQAL